MKRFLLGFGITIVSLLLSIVALNIAVDPLFQYHMPWFGLKPVVTDERYQNPGIAKTFDYDNALIGNSLSENFRISDLNTALEGKTVKLTFSGSHPIDWQYILDILKAREDAPQKIMIQLDPSVFVASTTELKHELPMYLFDTTLLNDSNYLLNVEIIEKFTIRTIKDNMLNEIPDYNTVFSYETKEFGKDFILSNIERAEVNNDTASDTEERIKLAMENIELLVPYIREMSDTEFVFYCAPVSVLFWDRAIREKTIEAYEKSYYETIGYLLTFDNVNVYVWSDDEFLSVISNLNNYRDESHYNGKVCRIICDRISREDGKVTRKDYQMSISRLFKYLGEYDYDSIWE